MRNSLALLTFAAFMLSLMLALAHPCHTCWGRTIALFLTFAFILVVPVPRARTT